MYNITLAALVIVWTFSTTTFNLDMILTYIYKERERERKGDNHKCSDGPSTTIEQLMDEMAGTT